MWRFVTKAGISTLWLICTTGRLLKRCSRFGRNYRHFLMARALLFSSSAVRQGIPVVSARSVRVFFFGFGQMTGPPARARPPRRALRARVGDKHRPPCSFAVREHTQIESRLMEPPPHAHRTPRDGKKQQRRKKNQGEAPTRAHLPGGRDCAASSHAVPTANRTSPARPHAQRAREGAGGGAHKRAARRRGPLGGSR